MMEEKKMELNNWMLLRDSSDELLEELDVRIKSVKKEMRKASKKEKERLQGVLNIYKAIREQMTENAYASSGQIRTLQEDIRKEIKAKQVELFKKNEKNN